MLKTPTASNLQNKTALLRLDLDVPLSGGVVGDTTRLELALPSLKFCLQNAQKTLILGHLGRPDKESPEFSLKPVKDVLERLIGQSILLLEDPESIGQWGSDSPLALLENLRFFPGEINNSPDFAQKLASLGNVFIYDAFAVGHRPSASVIGLPRLLPSFLGFHLARELEALSPIINKPERPIIMVLGGAKPDKLEFVDNFLSTVDKLLLGGRLVLSAPDHPKIIKADLTPDTFDITEASAHHFSSQLREAKTIIWNGPLGKFEAELYQTGTRVVAESIASSSAYKVAGGGDTEAVISKLGLNAKFDHISSGGGALLHYLAHRTLPVLDALASSPSLN